MQGLSIGKHLNRIGLMLLVFASLLLESCGGSSSPAVVLDTPTGVYVVIGDGSHTVHWRPVSNASDYRVYYKRLGGTFDQVTTLDSSLDAGAATQITHNGLVKGATYTYRVEAADTTTQSALSAAVTASQPSRWQISDPLSTGNRFVDIAWDGTKYLALDVGGNVYSSTDAINWSSGRNIHQSVLFSLIYDGGRFVAVGLDGAILTSVDGVQWNSIASGTTAALLDIDWNGSLYVASGAEGTIITSTDALEWTVLHPAGSNVLRKISWNGAVYVVISLTGEIYTSTDAQQWTQRTSGVSSLYDIAWTGTEFIALSGASIIKSSDGITWSAPQAVGAGTLLGISVSPARIVVSEFTGNLYDSMDGISWNTQTRPFGYDKPLSTLRWVNGQFIGLHDGLIATSADGLSWNTALDAYGSTIPTNNKAMAWSGTEFSLLEGGIDPATDNTLYQSRISADGISWASSTNSGMASMRSMVWADTQYVAVGSSASVATSPDGVTWSFSNIPRPGDLKDIAWNGVLLVAVGSGGIETSADGISWINRHSGTALNAVNWNGSQFVALGDSGNVLTSMDGITWTASTYDSQYNLKDLCWTGTQYVAVGYDAAYQGVTATSNDGAAWAAYTLVEGDLTHVTWTGSELIAIGSFELPFMYRSTDGVTWYRDSHGLGYYPDNIVSNGVDTITAGGSGTIVRLVP